MTNGFSMPTESNNGPNDPLFDGLSERQLRDRCNALQMQLDGQRHDKQVLEGTHKVLELLSRGCGLEEVLTVQCQEAERINPDMRSSILRLDNEKKHLYHCASNTLPKFYLDAINGVGIGEGVGSCGTAAFRKERVIVEDINTHPFWAPFKELALSANLQACWSQPILSSKGEVFGTFAMYYSKPKAPSDQDLAFIGHQAQIAGIVFEKSLIEEELELQNANLEERVKARTIELEASMTALKATMNTLGETQHQLIESEKYSSLGMLVAGITHEVNTPLGIAVTAISSFAERLDEVKKDLSKGALTKSSLESFISFSCEIERMTSRSLSRAASVISEFKSIAVDQGSDDLRAISLKTYLEEVVHTVSPKFKHTPYEIELNVQDSICLKTHPGAIFQIITNLALNSLVHGFDGRDHGTIKISSQKEANYISLDICDDGCGIPEEIQSRIFEPFVTTKRGKGGSGLGLSIVHQLVHDKLEGEISFTTDANKGTCFNIIIPISLSADNADGV